MNPILFGSRERPLFGVVSPACGQRRMRGIVICGPIGEEYQRAHRALRVLAQFLARDGHDVLRFDYFGTGDSAGEGFEMDMGGAVADAVSAVEEIGDVAAVTRCTLVGLRAGAAIAAQAANRVHQVDRVVLWDPVTDGEEYAASMLADATPLPGNHGGGLNVRGFLFSRGLIEEIARIDVSTYTLASPEVLIVISEDRPRHHELARHLSDRGRNVSFFVHEGPRSWTEMGWSGVGAIPAPLLEQVVTWHR